jgi:hypothetical protein
LVTKPLAHARAAQWSDLLRSALCAAALALGAAAADAFTQPAPSEVLRRIEDGRNRVQIAVQEVNGADQKPPDVARARRSRW